MTERIDMPVSVAALFDHKTRSVRPLVVVWEGKQNKIIKVTLHQTQFEGRTLLHIFTVLSNTSTYFKLVLNTSNLQWRVLEVSDGLPS